MSFALIEFVEGLGEAAIYDAHDLPTGDIL
jgi:hypothetical protein